MSLPQIAGQIFILNFDLLKVEYVVIICLQKLTKLVSAILR